MKVQRWKEGKREYGPAAPSGAVAIIPARAGSSGVPGKNRRRLAGLPLWRWSVESAKAAKAVSRIIVATDDAEILEGADALEGVEAVELPAELTHDGAPLDEAILWALEAAGVGDALAVAVLQPTVPIRPAGLIDRCISSLCPPYKSVLTANPLHFVWDESGKTLTPSRVLRQEMTERLYAEDGAVYIVRADDFRKAGSRVVEPIQLVETERTVDIDTEGDLVLAELMIRRERA